MPQDPRSAKRERQRTDIDKRLPTPGPLTGFKR